MQKFLGGFPLQMQLAKLQFKSFFRTGLKTKKIGATVLKIFMTLYMLFILGTIGFSLNKVLEGKSIPNTKVLIGFFVSIFVADFMFRYLLQKSPSLKSQNYLLLPIKKKVLAGHLIKKSLSNPLNWITTLIGLDVLIVLPYYGFSQFAIWLLVFASIPLLNFCLATLIKLISKNNLLVDIAVMGLCICYYVPVWAVYFSSLSKPVFIALIDVLLPLISSATYLLLALPLIGIALFIALRTLLSKAFYLDSLPKRKWFTFTTSFELNNSSLLVALIKQEVLLILRNKRAKTVVLMGLVIGAFYGLLLYSGFGEEGEEPSFMLTCFCALFVSSMASISFGQLIPAWDSAQRAFFNVQPLSHYQYIRSKYYVLLILGLASSTIALYYGFIYGLEVLKLQLTMLLYHVGINIPIILVFGLMNKKYIDINEKATMNYQGVNFYQFLMTAVTLAVPMLLTFTLNFYFGLNGALLIIAVMSLIAIAFSKLIVKALAKEYHIQKHDFLAVYGRK